MHKDVFFEKNFSNRQINKKVYLCVQTNQTMLQGVFKQKPPRKFGYRGRYYNRENEQIRWEKIQDGEKDVEANFGDRFRRKVDENRRKQGNALKKLAVLAAVLASLLYIISKI